MSGLKPAKLIIAGSRDMVSSPYRMFTWDAVQIARELLQIEPSMVVCGMATGIDRHGFDWAREGGIDVSEHHALWDKHGAAAGPVRNREMAQVADAALVIHNGSKGSMNMIRAARDMCKPVISIRIDRF